MGPAENIMQMWHLTSKGTSLSALEKVRTYKETKRDNQTKALFKAAERVWAPMKNFFSSPPPSKDGQARGKVRKHSSVSYAR
jgi:hypothetical protein